MPDAAGTVRNTHELPMTTTRNGRPAVPGVRRSCDLSGTAVDLLDPRHDLRLPVVSRARGAAALRGALLAAELQRLPQRCGDPLRGGGGADAGAVGHHRARSPA